MKKFKVYLAGAITGLNYKDSEDWRDEAKGMFQNYRNIEPYSPLRRKEHLAKLDVIPSLPETKKVMSSVKGIFTRDHYDVKSSDAVLVNLLGAERVSIGTVCEIALAWSYHKPVVLVCEDTNVHWLHPFIQEMVGFRVDTLEEGVDTVASILLP